MHFSWKHVKRILIGFVFLDLSFNVALIDSYIELITFQRKVSHMSLDMQRRLRVKENL